MRLKLRLVRPWVVLVIAHFLGTREEAALAHRSTPDKRNRWL
jgi:hypothetical protein